jgi:hypothetical protein
MQYFFILYALASLVFFLLVAVLMLGTHYYIFSYPHRVKKYNQSFTPSLALFIPCKGNFPGFAAHIQAMSQLAGEKTKIYYII